MIESMNPVCGKCGDKGFEEILVCCFMCQDAYEHRYCFKKASDIFKKDVKWACEDCLPTIIPKKPSPKKVWSLPSRRSERISTKNSPAKKADISTKKEEKVSPLSSEKTKLKTRSGNKPEQLESPDTDDSVVCDDDTVTKKADSTSKTVEKLSRRSAKRAKRDNGSVDKAKQPESLNTDDSVECDDDTVAKKADSASKTVEKLSPRSAKRAKLENGSVDKAEQLKSLNTDEVVECDKTEIEGSKQSLSNLKESKSLSGGTPIDLHGSTQTGGGSPSSGLQQNGILNAKPVTEPIWKGSFSFSCKKFRKVSGVAAHMSTLACAKAQHEATLLTVALKPRIVPRSTVWPKSYQEVEPNDESIGLFFFPEKNRDAVAFDSLVHEMTSGDLAMVCGVKNAELLVFSSMKLQFEHWRIEGKRYLWGVFRAKQTPSSS